MNLERVRPDSVPRRRAGDGLPGVPFTMSRPAGAGGEEKPLFRLNLLRSLQFHRRLAMGIALAGVLLALAYVVKAWPVYTAESQLYVQPAQPKVMVQSNEQSGPMNSTAYDSFVQQQVQNATNPVVLLSALRKLGPGAWQRSGESEQTAADRLGGAIVVARVGTSYEVTITAKAKDPQLAAKIANAVAASIVERASGEGNAGDAQRIAVLRQERDRIQDQLNADYSEQDALNRQLGMASIGTQAPDLIDGDIGRTREELIKAQTDHDQAEARFTAMQGGQGSSSAAIDAEADDLVAADAGLTSMKTSLNQRRAELITQMANLTPNNPVYKQDAAELATINSHLDSMMKDLRAKAAARIQVRLRTDLERTAGVEARLNGQLRQLAGAAASATPKLQRASDLATDIARLRSRYTTVDAQLHNLMLEDSAPGAVHLSVAAVAPLHPTISAILKKVIPLMLGGLILGLLAASIANHLDSRIYIAADVEQVLGFAPMAVLPDFDEASDEVVSEHLLRLSAAIEHARTQGTLKHCIFTGTAAGTGVTTVATRVRDILEAMGRPTVLLDASGTPPPAPRTNDPNEALDHPATERGSRSTALLQKVAAETEMRAESLALTDTAPLLISAETEYLARFVDSAIVVIESGVTTRAQLLAVMNALQRLDVGTVGFVLNRVGLAKADPAFRRSLHDIEEHHRAQGLSASRRTVRNSKMAEESSPEPRELPRESAVAADAASAAREPAQTPNAGRAHPAVNGGGEAHEPPPALADPMNADDPWWLINSRPQSFSAGNDRQPDKPREDKPREPVRAALSAPEIEPYLPPARSWENASTGVGDFRLQRPAEAARVVAPMAVPVAADEAAPRLAPAPQGVDEENPHETASRLNSLRGLLFSRGLKNLSKMRESEPVGEESVLPIEDEQERTVLDRKFAPIAVPVPIAVSASPARDDAPALPVVAEPEFLPPKEFIPINDRQGLRDSRSTARTDRGDADDDVGILPSRRGQYKRRG
jgi:polysaccharide biosynthesis transport protein